MKKIILSALALLGMGAIGTDAMAQFYVYDENGKVLYQMKEGTPAYIEFEAPASPSATGVENGHEWVDLGLESGTLWATCNVGAETPESYGSYFAWGETESKANYDLSTYKYMDHSKDSWEGYTKYTKKDGQTSGVWYNSEGNFIGDNKTELEDADDVAVQTWGGNWQMPTNSMQEELRDQCYWVWTTSYNGKDVNGYIVYKAKKAEDKGVKIYKSNTPSEDYDVSKDAHLFLPVAGYRSEGSLDSAGNEGNYWSRSLYFSYSDYAYALSFSSGNVTWSYDSRNAGFSVRPVVPAAK